MTLQTFNLLMRYDGDVDPFKKVVSRWVYFLVTVFVTRYAYEVWEGGDGYKTGDWLINYQGGFVRRGLIGELLFNMSSLGPDLLWTTFIVQSSIYFVLAWMILDLFFSKKRQVSELLYLFSPAFVFLFPFYSISGGFRKEILVYLSFTLLVWGVKRSRNALLISCISFAVYILAVFSHEIAFFGIPYFIYALYLHSCGDARQSRLFKILMIFFAIASMAGFAAAIIYKGNAATGEAILQSLRLKELDTKPIAGSIGWFQFTAADAFHGVWDMIDQKGYNGYLHALILSLFPIFFFGYHKRHSKILIVSFLFLIPLFAIGMDWGRWIAYWIFFVYMHSMTEDSDGIVKDLPLYLVILYGTLWAIRHYGNGALGMGIAEAFT